MPAPATLPPVAPCIPVVHALALSGGSGQGLFLPVVGLLLRSTDQRPAAALPVENASMAKRLSSPLAVNLMPGA